MGLGVFLPTCSKWLHGALLAVFGPCELRPFSEARHTRWARYGVVPTPELLAIAGVSGSPDLFVIIPLGALAS